jgi:hypothetical protein
MYWMIGNVIEFKVIVVVTLYLFIYEECTEAEFFDIIGTKV